MSVQALSRIAALLALDAEMLNKYIPKINDDGDDDNEGSRADLVAAFDRRSSARTGPSE